MRTGRWRSAIFLRDRDDMVVKAMSWALRELAKKEPARVDAYLAKNGELLAPRVLREVRNKLRTGLKNPGRGAATNVQWP
jgi:3-methyladenine DNA glycosylase AlkD